MSNHKKPQEERETGEADIDIAADYVIGALSAKRRARFEARLETSADLQDEVAFWQRHAEDLAQATEPMEPSSDVFDGLTATLDGDPQPGSTTIRSDEGDWQELFEGVFKKSLLFDVSAGEESYLLRLSPGSALPAHSHSKAEECLVMEGELIIGGARFKAGDYHLAPANVPHLPITTDTGALVFIRSETYRAPIAP